MNWPHVIEVSDGAGAALFDLPCYVISEPPSPDYDSNTGWRLRGYTQTADGELAYNVPQLFLWTIYAPVSYAERIRSNQRVRFGPKSGAYNPFHRPINTLIAEDANELDNKDDLFLRSMRQVDAMLELELGTQSVNVAQYDGTIATPGQTVADRRFTFYGVKDGGYIIADGLDHPLTGPLTTPESIAAHIGPAALPIISAGVGITYSVLMPNGDTFHGYAAFNVGDYTKLLWANSYRNDAGKRVPGYGWFVSRDKGQTNPRYAIIRAANSKGEKRAGGFPRRWDIMSGGAVHLYYGRFNPTDVRFNKDWWTVKVDGTAYVRANDANKPFFTYTTETWGDYGVLQWHTFA